MILTKAWFVLLPLTFRKTWRVNSIPLQFVPNVVVTPPRYYHSVLADGAPGVPRNMISDADAKKLGDASQQLLMIRGGAGKDVKYFEIFGNKSERAESAADKKENGNQGSPDSLGHYPRHFAVFAVLFLFTVWQLVTFWFVSIYLLMQYVTGGILEVPADIFNFSLFPLLVSAVMAVIFDSVQALRNPSKSGKGATPRCSTRGAFADATGDLIVFGSTGYGVGDAADGGCDIGNCDDIRDCDE